MATLVEIYTEIATIRDLVHKVSLYSFRQGETHSGDTYRQMDDAIKETEGRLDALRDLIVARLRKAEADRKTWKTARELMAAPATELGELGADVQCLEDAAYDYGRDQDGADERMLKYRYRIMDRIDRLKAETEIDQTVNLTRQAFKVIARERGRQLQKWGVQRHPWPLWLMILTEEVGEAAQAMLHLNYPPGDTTLGPAELRDQVRTEIIHVAAVAVSMLEQMIELTPGSGDRDDPS